VVAWLASPNSVPAALPALVRESGTILRRSAERPVLSARRERAAAVDRWPPATPILAWWLNSESVLRARSSVQALATILRQSAERPVLSVRRALAAAADHWLPATPILVWWLNSESVLRVPVLVRALPALLCRRAGWCPAWSVRRREAAAHSFRAEFVRAASQ
jgi:hypothetical protein